MGREDRSALSVGETIVFIGDTYAADVVGANRAGLDVIWINHKNEDNVDHLPIHCIYAASELAEVVKTMI